MKLRFKELNIPISRIVERILGFYPEYNCDSFYVLDAVVDLSKREMTLVFDDKLPEKIKRFLLERFVKVASAQLNIRVSLGFRPVSESLHHPDGVPLAGKEPSGVDDAEFDIDAFIKHTNGLASYLEQSDIKFDGEKIIIHVKNSFAEARIRSKKDDLRQAIKKTAGKNIPFEIIFEPIQNEAKPDIVPETPLILSPSSATSGESAQVLKPSKKESTVILGRRIRQAPQKICDVMGREKDVVVAGKVFGLDKWNGKVSVLTFNVTDFTDSIICKLIGAKAREVWNGINNGDELLVRGKLEYDDRIKEEVLMVRDLNQIELPKRKDNAEEKRVELHLHTKMSALDAIVDVNELFKTLKSWGHDAVALTDHGVVQSIPNFYFAAKKSGIKPIFGMEGYMVNDSEPIVREIEDKNLELMNSIYVVFDLETTGLDPSADEIIEIGAVKLKGTEVIGEFSSFVKPERNLSEKVTRITGISDRELEDAPSLSEVLPKFLEFCKDSVLVAHNATFDYRFVRNAVKQLYNEDWKLPYIDTLALSKSLLKSKSYSLDNVVKRLKLGDFEHHRASEDARITAEVFKKLLSMAKKRGIKKIAELENLRKHINISSLRPLHVTILAKNKTGLRNLYELVTLSHTKYFYKKPRIPKSILLEKREGLIIGSACISGELSKAYLSGANAAELEEIAKFFDFIEIMPLDVLDYNEAEAHITRENLKNMYREFYRIGKKTEHSCGDDRRCSFLRTRGCYLPCRT